MPNDNDLPKIVSIDWMDIHDHGYCDNYTTIHDHALCLFPFLSVLLVLVLCDCYNCNAVHDDRAHVHDRDGHDDENDDADDAVAVVAAADVVDGAVVAFANQYDTNSFPVLSEQSKFVAILSAAIFETIYVAMPLLL